MNNNYFEQILTIVQNENGKPIPIGIVLKKLFLVSSKVDKNLFFENIEYLISSKQLVRLMSGKLILGYPKAEVDMSKIYNGIIFLNNKLNGFITTIGQDKAKYFVHNSNLNTALNGDYVEFALLKIKKNESQNLIDVKVIKILKRNKINYVATYYKKENNSYEVITDDKKMYLPIELVDNLSIINDHTKFVYKIIDFRKDKAIAKIFKIIGNINDKDVDVLSIVYDNGVRTQFSDNIILQAQEIANRKNIDWKKNRIDLTNLEFITVDPINSRDFDDSIYCEKINNNQYHLLVSIADVSYYVIQDSELDKEAFKLSNSIYLFNYVIPMLPFDLSNDICSLNPNVLRFCLTVDMVIDENGNFVKIDVYQSTIKSHRRFSYDELNQYFSKTTILNNDSLSIKKMLDTAYCLHEILTIYRKNRGYINIEIDEPEIVFDHNNNPIDIKIKQHGVAQEIIENFMIAANEAVTIFANNHKIPFIYRIHDVPKNEDIKLFNQQIKKFNCCIPTNINILSPKWFSSFLDNNKQNKDFNLISLLLLQVMQKAKYSTKNIGHFGIASKKYTHFTSPIRRYADLIVHRLLKMFILDKDNYTNEQRQQLVNILPTICQQVNEKEIKATKIEREVTNLKFMQYMKNKIGQIFDSQVIGITRFGLFIKLPNLIEGFIKISNIKNDFYDYDDSKNQLVGRKTHDIIYVGNKFKVKCININESIKQIEFDIIRRIE